VQGTVGALVVRAWVEPGGGPGGIRARVLAINGPESKMHELGVATGMPAILELVEQGLRTALDLTQKRGSPDTWTK
jgi:hypothetical protein